MKKIVFFLYSLGPGGAERVICQLSNILSKDYHVEILTIEDNNFFEDDLNEKVSIKSFSKKIYGHHWLIYINILEEVSLIFFSQIFGL